MTQQEIENAKETLKKAGYFFTLWTKEDILTYAKNTFEVDLTNEQVDDIINTIERTHDATIGINWDVIGNAIEEILL